MRTCEFSRSTVASAGTHQVWRGVSVGGRVFVVVANVVFCLVPPTPTTGHRFPLLCVPNTHTPMHKDVVS